MSICIFSFQINKAEFDSVSHFHDAHITLKKGALHVK